MNPITREIKENIQFSNVIESMKSYVKKTSKPVELIPADKPLQRKFGWVDLDSGTYWTVHIAEMKKWINDLDSEKRELALKAMMTMEGKINFARSLTDHVNNVLESNN
jgi:predicted 3-demethylubiquinone-9 3-methyltransferase (glyoxalase superfamily)